MSHFSVLVVTNEQPTQDMLAAILQPWHEFECTGINDKYVVDVDRTQEALEDYKTATTSCLKAPDGTLHQFFDENGEWKREFSRQGEHGHRERFVPAGYEEVDVPVSTFQTAAEYISDYYGWPIAGQGEGDQAKYGFIELDSEGNIARCVDRTNPNKKWDWWVVGGRWSGHLRLKAGAEPILGRPGVFGSRKSDHQLATDQAQLGDVDVDALRNEARDEAIALWDQVQEAIAGHPPIDDFKTVRERAESIDAARTEYWAQPGVVALKERFPQSWGLDRQIDASNRTRDEYGQRAADAALSTFAIVKDGKWFERGEMGWFACVSDEKEQAVWSDEFAKLLDDLPPTSWLTVVDCHI